MPARARVRDTGVLAFVCVCACVCMHAAAQTLTLSGPPINSAAAITGTAAGAPTGSQVWCFVRTGTGALWGPKPQPGVSVPVTAGGGFTLAGWASGGAGDIAAPALRCFLLPAGVVAPGIAGATVLPPVLQTALASTLYDRATGTNTGTGGAVPPPAVPPPAAPQPGGAASLILAGPAPNSMDPITGRFIAPTIAGARVWCYVQTAGGALWGPKPQPGVSAGVAADGSFTLAGWASGGAGDAAAPGMVCFALPAGGVAPGIAGAPAVPAALTSAAVAGTTFTRASGVNTAVQVGGGGGAVPPPPPPVAPAPQPPAPAPPGAAALRLSGPSLNSGAAITGVATNAAAGARVWCYVRTGMGAIWGPKPGPGASAAVGAGGAFTMDGWASGGAGDWAAPMLLCFLMGAGQAAPAMNGDATVPATLLSTSLASVQYTRATGTNGAIGGGGGGAPAPVPPPPAPAPGAVVTLTGPAINSAADIVGRATGAAAGGRIWAYVVSGTGAIWGPKPGPGSSVAVRADGGFTIPGWASGGAGDIAAPRLLVLSMPAGAVAPTMLGAPALPATVTSAALGGSNYDRGSGANTPITGGGGGGVPPPPAPPPPAAGGELPWPPTAQPGAARAGAGGRIAFAGYSWITKDSGGGRVGPGNNIFSASPESLWVDDWGMHFNIIPTAGCTRWTASEVWLDRRLGWGTYLIRWVSPIEFMDPDVTWSPFFIWDDSGNPGNGFREIDIEVARWGNAGDPTSSQYVLRPLQSGGMVPGWRVRFETRGNTPIISGAGPGYGGCYERGAANFNNAGISKMTCIVRWFQYALAWYCYEGLWTMQTVANARNLIAAYIYPDAYRRFIPDQGDARVHINLWLQNGAQPRWNRRAHAIVNGFEFTPADIRYGNMPGGNVNVRLAGFTPVWAPDRSLQTVDEEVSDVPPHKQSSGDPTGKGLSLTVAGLDAATAALAMPSRDYEHESHGAGHLSGGAVAGIVIGAVVAAVALFAAGLALGPRAMSSIERVRSGRAFPPRPGAVPLSDQVDATHTELSPLAKRDDDVSDTAAHPGGVARRRTASTGHA